MKRIILGITIIILGIAMFAGFGYVFFFNKSLVGDTIDKVTGRQPATADKPAAGGDTDTPANTAAATEEKKRIVFEPVSDEQKAVPQPTNTGNFSKEDLARMAGSFAERFGSYSNQSGFSNLSDLEIFMSQRMRKWAANYIDDHRQSVPEIYYGITTKAIAETINEFDEDGGRASVAVQTRRREASGTTSNYTQAFNQDITITFIKEMGAWKVDSANWVE